MFPPHLENLPPAQRALWPRLSEIPRHFVLYGGTALALRLGHRSSVDFDFFSAEPFHPEELHRALPLGQDAEVLQKTENTLTLRTPGQPGVRLSFFGGLTLGQVDPPDRCCENFLSLASLKDLFATKLNVLYQRSEAKDYLDVDALLCAGLNLAVGLGCAQAVYGPGFNLMLPLKALTYFKDGDLPTLPDALRKRLLSAVASFQTPFSVNLRSDRILPA